MSNIEGSTLQPSAKHAPVINRFFTGLGLVVYAAVAFVIAAAILFDPGAGYQPKQVAAIAAPVINNGLDLLEGLPLPRL